MKRKIMLDTNFLVAPFQFSLPLFEQLEELYPYQELYTLKDAVNEAKSIKGGKYKDLVEKLLEVEDITVLETEGEGKVDDLLVDISGEFVIATNDKELKQRIIDEGRPVIIIRQRNHLEVINRRSENL
ncbi:MAG: PIN domain-containing protein [Candidatus Aenigmatarchaeota archaeon]